MKNNNKVNNIHSRSSLLVTVLLVWGFLLAGMPMLRTASDGFLAVLALLFCVAAIAIAILCNRCRTVVLRTIVPLFVCTVIICNVAISARAVFSFDPTTVLSHFEVTAQSTGGDNSNSTVFASATEGTINIVAKGYTTKDGCDRDVANSDTVTVTITNKASAAVQFDLAVTNATLSGISAGTGLTLDPEASFTCTVTSGSGASAAAVNGNITISNVSVVSTGAQETTTFDIRAGGSITVDSAAISASTPLTNASDHVYSLSASPASGYTFFGWMSKNSGLLSTSTSHSYTATEGGNDTVWPLFIKTGSAVYYIKDVTPRIYYGFFDEAITAAGSSGTIILYQSGTMYGSNNTVNFTLSGQTFVVPYAANATTIDTTTATNGMNSTLEYANKALVKANEGTTSSRFNTANPYLELTIPSGTTLNIDGVMAIGGTLVANSGVYPGNVPNGAHSNVNLKGTLNVNDGGILSVCGYLLGDGQLNIKDGGTAYQPYSLLDNRGAGYTIYSASGTSGYKAGSVSGDEDWLAPFYQFVMQNIQTKNHIEYGGTLKCYANLFTNSLLTTPDQYNVCVAAVIGDSNAILELANGAYADISFDSTAVTTSSVSQRVGTQTVKVYGGASLGSLSLSVEFMGTKTVNSSIYPFPLPFNYNIELLAAENTTPSYTIGHSMSLLPGSRLYVGPGATLSIGGTSASRFTVYDGLYDHATCATTTTYGSQNPYVAYPKPGHIKDASRKTAALVVDGTLILGDNLTFGGLIQTTGTGTVQVGSSTILNITTQYGIVCAPSLATKHWYFTGATVHNLTAGILNWNGDRINLENGKTYYGVDNISHTLDTFTYTLYTANDTTTHEPHTDTLNAIVTGSWCTVKGHNPDAGVVTAPTCTVDGYTTYTCQEANCGYSYQANPVPALGHTPDSGTITTAAKCETTGVKTFKCLVCGETTGTEVIPVTGHKWSVSGYTPKDNDQCTAAYTCENDSTHTKTEDVSHAYENHVCANCDYVEQFTITFVDTDDTVIKKITQAYGSAVTAPTPSKTGHTFTGWDQTVPTTMPDENMTIKAQWTINQYTITFNTAGGSEIAAITQDYGTAVTAPADPTREGYTFAGWQPEVPETIPGYHMAVTAQWTPIQYTITFDTGGGSAVASITQGYETEIEAPDDPTKTGYTFMGWSPAVPEKMPLGGATCKAIWQINQYTITFDTAGGSEVAAITQDYGTAVTAPADPTKTGYTFTGWNKTVPSTMPAEDMTITAEWTANSYQVKWETESGTVANVNVKYDSTLTLPKEPSKTGYSFVGWFTEEAGGTQITEGTVYQTDGPSTYYAHWKINQYTINFDADGGSEVAAITQDYGTAVTAPADPTKTGYTFTGWNMAIPETMPAYDVEIKAIWQINQYTITFDTDGGSEVAAITQNYGTTVSASAEPTKEGYTFDGWEPEVPATIPAENVTIKAKWTVNQYTITFDTDGGSAVEAITLDFGSAVTNPTPPSKEGYTFDGWEPSLPGTMPAEDLNVVAKWSVARFTITFINGTETLQATTFAYGTTPSCEQTPAKDANSCTTYTFAGWSTSANGKALNELPAVTGNATYYAVFAAQTTHTISTDWTYDENAHWHVCENCSLNIQEKYEAHNFVDNVCSVCGFEKLSGLFDIYATNIKAGDCLDMFFYVKKADVADYSGVYAKVTKYFADAEYDTVIDNFALSTWESYSSDLYRFCFDDISAKEMTDQISVVVYAKSDDGTTDVQISETFYETVENYAIRALEAYADKAADSREGKMRIALVDMLYYGAAAQEYFGYNLENLATARVEVDTTYKGYATAETPVCSDYAKNNDDFKNFLGDSVTASSNMEYNFYISGITSDMTAYITYTNHYGTAKEQEVAGSDFYTGKNVNGTPVLGVPVKGLAVADGRQLITCIIKDSSGATKANAVGSIESFVCRNLSGDDGHLFAPLIKFVDSARVFFNYGK